MINLNELKVVELKEMAKEAKVPNWWTLNKGELITELEKEEIQEEEIQEEEIQEEEIQEEEVQEELQEEEKGEREEKEVEEKEDDIITLKEIIAEVGIKGTKARRLLRGSDIERPYKRWEWSLSKHKEIVEEVYELFSK